MAVVLARVDNRLIHGQVLEAWVPHVRADYIVVVDDGVAADPFRKQLMTAVVPQNLQVEIVSLAGVGAFCQRHVDQNNALLILFSTPTMALQAYERGMRFSQLNLGNMHAADGKVSLSCTLSVDAADMQVLDQLAALGVEISAQCIPTDRCRGWNLQSHCLGC
ncbi:MAG: PTS sugar transporter subunit IIB [Desulfuromonadaceae bacterium]|nr:PTS sugar transporter subunit IIB [Desulfuromonadaceae bacterium]